MPLFGRRKKQPPTPVAPTDPDLAPLDVEQAARLRRLVHDDLAGRGIESEILTDHLRTADHTFGLKNLSRTVAAEDAAAWPGLVAHHLDLMLDPTGSEELALDELGRRVLARLVPDVPEMREAFPDAFHPTADLMLALCIDHPDRIETVPQTFYEERGGLQRWWATGFANLRTLVEEVDLEHVVVGEQSEVPRFDIVEGDSVYVASLAAVLPELLARHSQVSLGRGVLVAVPDRTRVLFRVVDGAEALPAIGEIAKLTAAAYASSAGPLSPHVYLVDPRGWHQLTEIEGDTIRVLLGPEAVDAFDLDDRG